jgi:rhodanese-related sulfurtransferase
VNDLQVVDVRGAGELAEGDLPGAVNLPLPRLRSLLHRLDPHRPVLVYCAGGYRSIAAASLLRASGFVDVSDLLGGWTAWRAQRDSDAGGDPIYPMTSAQDIASHPSDRGAGLDPRVSLG